MPLTRLDEAQPGEVWSRHFARLWPAYERWLEGYPELESVSAAASRGRLRSAMPELAPVYEALNRLAQAAGGGPRAERFLTLYRPPPFLAGCSIVVDDGSGGGEPFLLRNYDYDPGLWEATLLRSAWCGRWVLALSDCLWGALDGINEHGLVVALAFGGRRTVGDGFGIPLIVRYLLETCSSAAECRAALGRMASHMAYNLSVLDRQGDHFTAYLTPGLPTRFAAEPISTNHQEEVVWPEHATATRSVERATLLRALADRGLGPEELIERFRETPLYASSWNHAFGTLYTALYRPLRGSVELLRPDSGRDVFAVGPRHVERHRGDTRA